MAARFARRLAVPFAGAVLANGCGVVTTGAFTASGEAGVLTDAPSNDSTGTVPLDASSCQPADVETYVPGAYHPATAEWQGACTAAQVSDFYADCLDPVNSSAAACGAFSAPDASGSSCAACILTPDTASAYGPLISHGTFITSNVAGCIQLTVPSELSCAKAEAALVGCELAACEANCPVEDPVTRLAYDGCASAADGAGCQSYEQMAECAQSTEEAGAAAAPLCLLSFKAFYDAVVPHFCGVPSQEAGTVLVDAGAPADAAGADAAVRDSAAADSAASASDR